MAAISTTRSRNRRWTWTAWLKRLDIPDLCSGIVRDCPAIPRVGRVESVHYFTGLANTWRAVAPASFDGIRRSIAVTLLALFHEDEADCAFVMSGDTDLMPAIRAARRVFPDRQV